MYRGRSTFGDENVPLPRYTRHGMAFPLDRIAQRKGVLTLDTALHRYTAYTRNTEHRHSGMLALRLAQACR
ncbi:MAG: hypothetical protein O3C60_14900 [Planctomycetota bacterium]|nr:hypothetical protein [Planctomycetota bacterium]